MVTTWTELTGVYLAIGEKQHHEDERWQQVGDEGHKEGLHRLGERTLGEEEIAEESNHHGDWESPVLEQAFDHLCYIIFREERLAPPSRKYCFYMLEEHLCETVADNRRDDDTDEAWHHERVVQEVLANNGSA